MTGFSMYQKQAGLAAMPAEEWFASRAAGQGMLRMFCFNYAGGSASTFLQWQAAMLPEIEVIAAQLPGRSARLMEAPVSRLSDLIQALAARIDFFDRRPFVFFGHSFGALVAFELARFCRLHHLRGPRALLVSGCNPPQRRGSIRPLHLLDQEEMIEALGEYGGTPTQLLQNRELMQLVSPAIRADFAMAVDYQYRPGLSLTMPITVFGGEMDVDVDPQHLHEWKRETSAECRVKLFPGGHFFLISEETAFLPALRTELMTLTASVEDRTGS